MIKTEKPTRVAYRLSTNTQLKLVNNTWAMFIDGELHRPLNDLESALTERLVDTQQNDTDIVNSYMESL